MAGDKTLDLTGLKCPLPALRVRKELSHLAAGQTVKVICTDQMAAIDIPHAVRETLGVVVSHGHDGEVLWFLISKK